MNTCILIIDSYAIYVEHKLNLIDNLFCNYYMSLKLI